MKDSAKGLGEYVDIRYLEPGKACFRRTMGGFLSLEAGEDERYPRVNLHRAFPFNNVMEFISVRDDKGKEVGMIRNALAFPPETVELFEQELNRRYFAPAISRIVNIKEEFGYSYWDVATNAGPCRFTVKGTHQNIAAVGNDRYLIIDVDGNRFEIENIHALDDRSFKKLEIFL